MCHIELEDKGLGLRKVLGSGKLQVLRDGSPLLYLKPLCTQA